MATRTSFAKARSLLLTIGGGTTVFAAYSLWRGDEKFYADIAMPLGALAIRDAEKAHRFAVRAFQYGLVPNCSYHSKRLESDVFDMHFSNPLGLAAGFDKHAECFAGAQRVGFGFTEIGSVTPRPQAGNHKPRVFRLPQYGAIINRYGFNSDGAAVCVDRLARATIPDRSKPIGVNLGMNADSPDGFDDFVQGVRRFGKIADYLVVNISSPNTLGLRDMQGRKQLAILLDAVVAERDRLVVPRRVPLLVKLAPDLTKQDMRDIAAVLRERPGGVDGLIVSNTTVRRGNVIPVGERLRDEPGGVSGRPMAWLALRVLREMYRLTEGRIPIVACGGIESGADAYERVRAGASLLQLYTAMTYQGPPVVKRVLRELDELLERDGFERLAEAVGADYREERKAAAKEATV